MPTMFNIKLNETQLRDLKVFLERCDLRGAEAFRFMSLAQAIGQAEVAEGAPSLSAQPKVE